MWKTLILILFICSTLLAPEFRKKVVILDTGIESSFPQQYLCSEGHKDFSGEGLEDTNHHGTHLAYIISDYIDPKKECIIVVKFYNNKEIFHSLGLHNAYKYVLSIHPDYVNMSFGGEFPLVDERQIIRDLLDQGTVVSVAAGNNGRDFDNEYCGYYPACYANTFHSMKFHVVGSCKNGNWEPYSNRGSIVKYCENGTRVVAGPYIMSGTSQANAISLGKFIKQNHERR